MSNFSVIMSQIELKAREWLMNEFIAVEGFKPDVPLVALHLWRLMDEDERKTYCCALAHEGYLSKELVYQQLMIPIDFSCAEAYESLQKLSLSRESKRKRKCSWRDTFVDFSNLRKSIGHTNTIFMNTIYRSPLREKNKVVEREMEEASGEPNEDQTHTKNVVVLKEDKEEIGVASQPYIARWDKLSTNESTVEPLFYGDRITYWQTVEWLTTHDSSKVMMEACLPREYIDSVIEINECNKTTRIQRGTMPQFIKYNINQFAAMDMSISFMLDSSPFQSGIVIASFYYWEEMTEKRDTIAEMFQQPHVLITAGASNEATLEIPYRYPTMYMNTKKRDGFNKPLCMGTLRLRELVPLKTGAAGPTRANISIFVRFKNERFSGMIDGTIAQPEMEAVGALLPKVLGVVDKVIGDVNCDNPPNPKPPTLFVPTASHSWSHGTGTSEPIHTLRLDGGIVGVGRSPDVGYSETQINRIVQMPGLLKNFDWNAADVETNKTGALLWSCDAHPQFQKDKFIQTKGPTGMTRYYLPPVSVVASLTSHFRGSLVFRWLFSSTIHHKGRVLIAYIPGVSSTDKITLAQARNSAHVIFTLGTATELTFVVPFISDRPWWPRSIGGPQRSMDFRAPSRVYMFVLNPLVPMESIAKQVTIVPIVAASSDFEVSMPCQPSIGLGRNNANQYNPLDNIRFKEGYYPVYAGEWRSFFESTKYIFRYGEVTDHVAQVVSLPKPEKGDLYLYQIIAQPDFKDKKLDNLLYTELIYVPFIYEGYVYLAPARTPNKQSLQKYLDSKGDINDLKNWCINYASTQDYLSLKNLYFKPFSVSAAVQSVDREMEDSRLKQPNRVQPVGFLPSTQNGRVTFGESFNDLKDFCRRYQLYTEKSITIPNSFKANKNIAIMQLPLVPFGINLPVTEQSTELPLWNILRDGIIPIVASGFRATRGGMRLRIVTSYRGLVWVQHHHDLPIDKAPVVLSISEIKKDELYRNHGYAYYVQDTNVNSVIEIEIPFYNSGVYNFLSPLNENYQKSVLNQYAGLGYLLIGVEGQSELPSTVDVAVYYSIADDCSFNIWTGFSSFVFCDEVITDTQAYEVVEREMYGSSLLSGAFTAATSNALVSGASYLFSNPIAALKSDIKNEIRKEFRENINPLVNTNVDKITTETKSAMQQLSTGFLEAAPKQILLSGLSQLLHIMNNMTPSTVAIAVATTFGQLFSLSYDIISKFIEITQNLLEKVWSSHFAETNEHQEGSAEREGFFEDLEDKDQHAFSAFILTALATVIGVSVGSTKDLPKVLKGVKEEVNLFNSCFIFFRNSTDLIVACFKRLIGENDEVAAAKMNLERDFPETKQWLEECLALLDPRREQILMKSNYEASRVYAAAMYGGLIITSYIDSPIPGSKVVCDVYQKIVKLRDELIRRGTHPAVRAEPFSIYHCGPPGIGKSYLTYSLCKDMLQKINYRTQEDMIYWVQLGSKFMNGIRDHPVVAVDESYSIGGTFEEEEIALHLKMCSSGSFNPEQAAVENKERLIAPKIYYMNSNVKHPALTKASCNVAILRRRKLLISSDYTPEIKKKYPNGIVDASILTEEELKDQGHLQFWISQNPADVNAQDEGPYTYAQLSEIVCARFKTHNEKEMVNLKRRLAQAYCLDPSYNPEEDLEYVHHFSYNETSLQERFNLAKQRAKEILEQDELRNEDNDGYFRGVINKFFPSATPEGFVSEQVREHIHNMIRKTGLSKGAVQKIFSGQDIDRIQVDQLEAIVIPEWFSEMIKSKSITVSFTEQANGIFLSLFTSKHKSIPVGGLRNIFAKTYTENMYTHWSNYSSVDQISSYVYWLFRYRQYESWLNELFSKLPASEKKVAIEKLTDLMERDLLHRPLNMDEAVQLSEISNRVVDVDCPHILFFTNYIRDWPSMKYSIARKTISYTDALGLTDKISPHCTCLNQNNASFVFNNTYIHRMMKIMWANTHGLTGDTTENPFCFQEYASMKEEAASFLQRVREWCQDWWNHVLSPLLCSIVRFLIQNFIPILSALIMGWAVSKVVRRCGSTAQSTATFVQDWYTGRTWSGQESGNAYYAGERTPHYAKTPPAARENGESMRTLENKLQNNTIFISCEYLDHSNDKRIITGRCFGIRNHQVIVIKHYLQEFSNLIKEYGINMKPKFKIVYFAGGRPASKDITWEQLNGSVRWLSLKGNSCKTNIGILTLPKYFPQFKNITSSIPYSYQHATVGSVGTLVSPQLMEGKQCYYRDLRLGMKNMLYIAGDEGIDQIVLDVAYKYGVHGKGFCGSLLISDNICNGNAGIVGIHVGGAQGIGYSEPLVREIFEDKEVQPPREYVVPVYESLEKANVDLDANLILYGTVPDKYAHKESGNSKIVPSLIQGQVYPVKTEPNPLRPDDPRQPPGSNPLRDGCRKHGTGFVHVFNEYDMKLVSEDMRQRSLQLLKNPIVQARKLTLEEACCGSTKIPNVEALNWNSSPGFPLSSYRENGDKGKKYLFDLKETNEGYKLEGIDPRLESLLSLRHEMREKKLDTKSLYIDCLKDYRLSPQKCAIPGKTRIFSIAPVFTTIEIRKYMGLYLSAYKSNCIKYNHAIGINRDSFQWTELAQFLLEKGNNIVTGDYQNYGPTLSSQIVLQVLEDIVYWHEKNNFDSKHIDHLTAILENDILNPLHLCGNLVYQTLEGICSGSPITAELNSEVGKYYIRLAFLGLAKENDKKFYSMKAFNANVRDVVYGDDFIISVTDAVKEWFNGQTMRRWLSSYGIVLTGTVKDKEIEKWNSLTNSTFLKSGFKRHPIRDCFLAPLDTTSIEECLNWCKKSNDIYESTKEVMLASLNLAYGQGPEYYEKHREKIREAASRYNIEIELPSWITRDHEYFEIE